MPESTSSWRTRVCDDDFPSRLGFSSKRERLFCGRQVHDGWRSEREWYCHRQAGMTELTASIRPAASNPESTGQRASCHNLAQPGPVLTISSVGRKFGGQQLNGDFAPQPWIERQMNLAHSAFAQSRKNFVSANLLSSKRL